MPKKSKKSKKKSRKKSSSMGSSSSSRSSSSLNLSNSMSASSTTSTTSMTLSRGRLDSLVRQIEAQANQAFRDRVASIIQTQTMHKQTNPNNIINYEAMAYITAISNSTPVEIGARLNDVYNCIFNVNSRNNCTLNFNVSLLNDNELQIVKQFLDEQTAGRNLSQSATDLLSEIDRLIQNPRQ